MNYDSQLRKKLPIAAALPDCNCSKQFSFKFNLFCLDQIHISLYLCVLKSLLFAATIVNLLCLYGACASASLPTCQLLPRRTVVQLLFALRFVTQGKSTIATWRAHLNVCALTLAKRALSYARAWGQSITKLPLELQGTEPRIASTGSGILVVCTPRPLCSMSRLF